MLAVIVTAICAGLFSWWKSRKSQKAKYRKNWKQFKSGSLQDVSPEEKWGDIQFENAKKTGLLMTYYERRFFAMLRKTLSRKYYVCPKVRVLDVLICNNENFKKGGHQLGRWHVDFVVMGVYDSKIKFCIEYDDDTHDQPGRNARDRHLDFVMDKAGVKLLRVKHKADYTVAEIKDLLLEYDCQFAFYYDSPGRKQGSVQQA